MNHFKKYLALATLASVISAGSAVTSMASPKVTKNTAAWVEEAKEQAEAERAAEEAKAAEEAAAAAAEAAEAAQKSSKRQQVVDYALSFVGGRYVWGGTDPHTGADCSGFTGYILRNAGGVSISRSSAEQAGEGRTVSAENMQPGDLLFYSKGGGVNHVAMYIGNGQVVHASSSKTGIIVSAWNYRTPVRIASFLD
ncbi:C40 family peptidase [Stomatobaculum longum]|uniref:C40 family peptidase n=1 Tax=Stomatobaculum longum TaxID=796942 RepID=UPI0028E1A171|nr:C40 family peptidase [Stomatobaculum longum]